MHQPNRRDFLAGTATAVALGVAGCSSEADSSTKTQASETSSHPTEQPGALKTAYSSRAEYAHPGEQFDDFEDLSKWTALTGQLSGHSPAFVGSQSGKLEGKAGQSVMIERAADGRDFSGTELSMAVRTTTPGRIAVNIRLVDPFGNNTVRSLRQISHDSDDVTWFRTAPGTFRASEDAFDITQIERVQIHMLNASELDASVAVDDMRTHPKPDTGYIVLSWDDSRRSFYDDAAPMNDEYGYPVSMATAPRLVGGGNFMSVGQLKERQENGDDIVAHASVSVEYNESSAEEIHQRMSQIKQWLTNQGFTGADAIVYPGNNYNATVLSVAGDYHYVGGMNQAGDVNTTGVHSFDPLVLPRTIGHDFSTGRRVVDNVAANQECGIIGFHDFDVRNTMDAGEYQQLVDYIDSKGDAVEVITLDELWELRKRASHGTPSA